MRKIFQEIVIWVLAFTLAIFVPLFLFSPDKAFADTTTKTWAFAADSEGLADAGNSTNLTFAAHAGDGNPADSIKFTTATKGQTMTEFARRSGTGETWETWGIPSGATVTDVQITAWDEKLRANSKLSSHSIKARIIGSGGSSVHSAGDLLDVALGTTVDSSWQSPAGGTSQAVDAGSQASTTDVRLELEYTVTTTGGGGSTNVDQGFDQIQLTVTYTPPPSGTITVGTTGSQTAKVITPSTSNFIGSFTFIRDTGSADVTQIIVSETDSTLSAQTYLSNLRLRYETAGSCSWDGTETVFGTAASFDASENATVTGTMAVGTSQVCVYVEVDVASGAPIEDTIEIEITDPSTEVTVSAGDVTPATPVAIDGATTIGPTTEDLMRHGSFFVNGVEQYFFWAN
jgi:hypothetical protein